MHLSEPAPFDQAALPCDSNSSILYALYVIQLLNTVTVPSIVHRENHMWSQSYTGIYH